MNSENKASVFLIIIISVAVILTLMVGNRVTSSSKMPKQPVNDTTSGASGSSDASGSSGSVVDEPFVSVNYQVSEIIQYFQQVALDSEYGDRSKMHVVHKWTVPIRLCISGMSDKKDEALIASITDRMNSVAGFPGISLQSSNIHANLIVYFLDDETFDIHCSQYGISDVSGFVRYTTKSNRIDSGTVYIRSSISQQERNSVIWEELMQATGLTNDSYMYTDSLFYNGRTMPQEPSELDWLLFRLLYHPSLEIGMNANECTQAITLLFMTSN